METIIIALIGGLTTAVPATIGSLAVLRKATIAADQATAANAAVNHKPAGSPSMSRQMDGVVDKLDELREGQVEQAEALRDLRQDVREVRTDQRRLGRRVADLEDERG
jgi:hypothetical protein